MTRMVSIDRWRGKRDDEILVPADMLFKSRPAPKSCKGCLFEHQRSFVCASAIEVAKRAGLEHCEDDGVIYVAIDVDPRQTKIVP